MTGAAIDRLGAELTELAGRPEFSGVVIGEWNGQRVVEVASGLANRAEALPMTVETRLATASATKGFTALTAVSMIEDGMFALDTTVREVVGDALPDVDPAVTVEHLLGHTSGIGDYLDEEQVGDIDDHVLDVPVHRLEGPEDYLPILVGRPQVWPPGTRFAYNNSGFVILALIIERLADRSYHDEVRARVFEPAAMTSTDFLRSDRLPAGAALGYLRDGRTNVHHLPVIGTGDGGAYSTAPDLVRFWTALFDGRIVGPAILERMIRPAAGPAVGRYGLGFWIGSDRRTVQLEGMDAGVSFRSGANPDTGFVYCVMANDSSGAWPLARAVDWALVTPGGTPA
jgi:CubicO group peptidase (beta-lactamase class C family)